MLKRYADLLVESMVAHDPGVLPLADRYAATENSIPGSLGMMTSWRTVSGVRQMGQYVADEPAGQIFFTACLDERGSSTAFWARLKVEAGRLSEIEMYSSRSRAESGFVMLADEIGTYPNGWTSPIPDGGRASRDELHRLGEAIFDGRAPAPEADPDCLLMEVGGVVLEDPEYLDLLMTGELQERVSSEPRSIPAGLGPDRPSDPKARVVAIDEEQGVVVAIGVIPGFVSPYVVTKTTESCFVPAEMIHMHYKTLRPEMFAGRRMLVEMPAVAVNCELVRMHSGKIQGIQLFNKMQAPGGGTPWVKAG
jgi:hypothetical protein